jgi:hypothetical protein
MSFATLLPKLSWHAVLATILLVVSCSRTADTDVSMLAPGGMSPSAKVQTSPDGTVVFWGNGTLRSKLYLYKGPVTIAINARGNTVDGESPIVQVNLGEQLIGRLAVDSRTAKDYVVRTVMQETGTAALELSFVNHIAKPNPLAGTILTITKVTITQGGV